MSVAREEVPDVEGVGDRLLLRLVLAADMVTAPLIGHQLPVRLHHHGIEVLDAVLLVAERGSNDEDAAATIGEVRGNANRMEGV